MYRLVLNFHNHIVHTPRRRAYSFLLPKYAMLNTFGLRDVGIPSCSSSLLSPFRVDGLQWPTSAASLSRTSKDSRAYSAVQVHVSLNETKPDPSPRLGLRSPQIVAAPMRCAGLELLEQHRAWSKLMQSSSAFLIKSVLAMARPNLFDYVY